MSDEARDQLQSIIGPNYKLAWIIGHGGMSTVWLADDLLYRREVAIKVLRPEYSNNSEFLSRFRNEAVAAEGIQSDNVVATYDYQEVSDRSGHMTCFIVMEYVRGETLADMLARYGTLEEAVALDVLEQAAHGLSIIHRMGLVHRDIKPGNLLITENGQVKITDFGIAKAAAAVPLTRTGMVVGTAQYVSPEQAQGLDTDSATDVYSLAVVGYEMLAGQRPFSGDSGVSVALAHVSQAPPALPTSISAQTRELIGIALRKDPATRFADGNEFALAISAVRLGQRPPQPASAAMQRVAEEPSPTASTQILAQVAQPTTVYPAAQQRPARPTTNPPGTQYTRRSAPARPARHEYEQSNGVNLWVWSIVASLVVIVIVVAVIVAVQTGVIGSNGSRRTTDSTAVTVTTLVTPTAQYSDHGWGYTDKVVTQTVGPSTPSQDREGESADSETLTLMPEEPTQEFSDADSGSPAEDADGAEVSAVSEAPEETAAHQTQPLQPAPTARPLQPARPAGEAQGGGALATAQQLADDVLGGMQ